MALALHAVGVIETAITNIATDGQMCLCLVAGLNIFIYFFIRSISNERTLCAQFTPIAIENTHQWQTLFTWKTFFAIPAHD